MIPEPNLHLALVPFGAQGHIIPALDFARLLAERGVLVTFVMTPLNLSRNRAFVARAKEFAAPIRFLVLDLPCEEVGLPAGCENFDLLPPDDITAPGKLYIAFGMLREPLRLQLQRSSPLISGIISEFSNPWTRFIARELGVPFFVWYTIPCFAQLCEHRLFTHKAFDGTPEYNVPVVVPDFPLRVELTRLQAPVFSGFPGLKWMIDDILDAEASSQGVLVNTFTSLEQDYVDLCEKAKGKKVWSVGPVSLCNKLVSDAASRGNEGAEWAEKCLAWLDSMAPQSVLYVSFGSLVRYPLAQVVELALGLEAARCPVIWSIKAADGESAMDEWLAQGFEERTKDQIFLIRGWAPQLAILSHPSTGGFLTHCGWNSALEGIAAGIPMITWPGFADQFITERFLVDAVRVGAPSGVKKPHWNWKTMSDDDLVNREDVKRAVEKLMGAGIEAQEMRKRATELGKMARSAMEVGGSSHQSIDELINAVCLLSKNQNGRPKEVQQLKD